MTDDEELALLTDARHAGYELVPASHDGRGAWRWLDVDRAFQPMTYEREQALRLMRARLARRDLR